MLFTTTPQQVRKVVFSMGAEGVGSEGGHEREGIVAGRGGKMRRGQSRVYYHFMIFLKDMKRGGPATLLFLDPNLPLMPMALSNYFVNRNRPVNRHMCGSHCIEMLNLKHDDPFRSNSINSSQLQLKIYRHYVGELKAFSDISFLMIVSSLSMSPLKHFLCLSVYLIQRS